MYPDPSIAGGLTEGQSPATSLAAGGKTLPVLPPIVGRISNAAQLYTESVRTSRNGPPPDELRATPSAGSADDVPLANRSQGMAEDAEPPASANRSSTSFDVSDLRGPAESMSPAAGEAKAKKQSISEENSTVTWRKLTRWNKTVKQTRPGLLRAAGQARNPCHR